MKERVAFSFMFLVRLFFLEQSKIQGKIEGKILRFPTYPLFGSCTACPLINIPHQSGTFVMADEPTLTHYNHPKSMVFTLGFILSRSCDVGLFFLPLLRITCVEFGFPFSVLVTISLNNCLWHVFFKWKL